MITRRLLAALAAALPLAATPVTHAQEVFPARPVQIVLPYPPGNSIDLLVRALAAQLAPTLGQPAVVVNRDGAAALVGSVAVARAAPDGYTLLYAPALVASVLPVTQPTAGLTATSFRPICQVFNNTMALAVRPDSPIRDLRSLQAAARANPGRLTYGTLGITSIPHLAMVQWLGAAGVEVEHVPFRADSTVLTEVLAGRLDIGSIVLGAAAGRGDVRVLAVFDAQRHPDFPEAPTAIEQGFEVAPASFGGLFAPAGTPEDRIARIEAACAVAAASEPYRAAARTGAQPTDFYLGRADFARRLQTDIEQKAEVLRGVRLN
ncbi:tripartite tricarboxylate transporter substrate binding protein [Plastoroseomonas arctica]|uniref:Tripartite tricarboxylate transporter substrate binding protein n=1 Tax=Plastoroseomonas arctica TaxID=1509237 RepID=A0AAF1KPV0_9PROT|nr:tripartite tricarboxylate transporter substrate binding protein [Plastoroseomonas arctica]MBR0656548.1 tripartite tricarboxylate transporter substrate binding protein [Plastoroseomonas arctica]